jgi:hypothetical protein
MEERYILFWVFVGFFVLIGLASLLVLLGFRKKAADPGFRKWAVGGFLGSVTTAVIGLFRILWLSGSAPISVTLLPPPEITAPATLVTATYHYDEPAGARVNTQKGTVVPVLSEGGWQVLLPGKVADKPIGLTLVDKDGGSWEVDPFYPNHTSRRMRAILKVVPSGSSSPHFFDRVGIVLAAEPGGEPATQQQAGLKFNNYARPLPDRYERPFYEWRVFVDEPSAVLDTIQQVDYVLHPTFPEPFRRSQDRTKNFELIASGWGQFTILITVHYTNGREAKASYPLDLSKQWPAAPVPAQQAFALRLEKIVVLWDGSTGRTGWTFDVLVNSKAVLALPKRNYNNEKKNKQNENVPAAADRWFVPLKERSGQAIRVEVKGKRSFGGRNADTATGAGTIEVGKPLALTVKNAKDEKKGSFVFHFSTAASS